MSDKVFFSLLALGSGAIFYILWDFHKRVDRANDTVSDMLPVVPDDFSDYEQVKEFLFGGFPTSLDEFIYGSGVDDDS